MSHRNPINVSLLNKDHAYYLVGINPDGYITQLDGGHSHPFGVAQARKLFDRLGFTEPDHTYLMLESSPIPDDDIEIDEEAVATCRAMLEREWSQRAAPRSPSISPPPPPVTYKDEGEEDETLPPDFGTGKRRPK